MHKMEELKEMLCEELDKITKKGELSAGSLDVVDKLTHSIKSIDTIMAMKDAGYSNESGYSYARGRGSNVRRDSMGRYSRDMMDSSYERDGNRGNQSNMGGSYARGGYSRADAMEDLVEQLREMEMTMQDDESKRMVQKWIKQAEMR